MPPVPLPTPTNFSYFDPGGCNCPACSRTFTVVGCNAIAYPGVTVTVYDHAGGTVLASGTTNGSGQIALSWAGTTSIYATVTGQSARFDAFGASLTGVNCVSTPTLALSVASGYECFHGCLIPAPDVLNVSGDPGHPNTLTWVGGLGVWKEDMPTWYGIELDQGGNISAAAGSCILTFGTIMTTVSCPPSLHLTLTTSCPYVTLTITE